MATVYQDIYCAKDNKFEVFSDPMPENGEVRITIRGFGKTGLVFSADQLRTVEAVIVAARANQFKPERNRQGGQNRPPQQRQGQGRSGYSRPPTDEYVDD